MAVYQPTYEDMGKVAKDFFNKGYHINIFKMSGKKPGAVPTVDTTMSFTNNFEDNTAVCDFEAKQVYAPWGLTTTSKIDSAKMVTLKSECCNSLAEGLKITIDSSYNIDSASRTGKLTTTYKVPQATIDVGIDGGDEDNMMMNGSLVVGYNNFMGGYQFAYDTNEGNLKKNNAAVGYVGNDFNVHADMENAETITGIVHYKFKNNMEAAIQGTYTSGDDPEKTNFGVGLKYIMGACSAFKAKIDNKKLVTMACEMKVTDAATLTLCAQCDDANAGKIGCAVEFGGQ